MRQGTTRMLSILLALSMALALLPTTASADWDDYGYYGETGATQSVVWMVDKENGILNFVGQGKMKEVYTGDISIIIPWFKYSTLIKEVTILNSTDVSNICPAAFATFTSLQRANIPRVTQIGASVFWGCTALEEIIFSSSISEIGQQAFEGCTSLTNVDLPSGLNSISEHLFRDCTALTSVRIPNGITDIAGYAFYDCESLKTVNIPDSVSSIGDRAFSYCYGLERLIIPASVTTIDPVAFIGCNKLTIYCYKDSTAHQYAIDYSIPFVLLDEISLHTVTFDSQGGLAGGSEIPAQSVPEGECAIMPVEPSREGYTFQGWYTDQACTMPYQFDEPVTQNITLYAGWEDTEPDEESGTTELDLLALSLLSYKEPTSEPQDKSIRELIGDQWDKYWNEDWEKVGIRNNELFANLADWKVYDYRADKSTGFAAYAFYHNSNEIVIAYRGSEELNLKSFFTDPDWLQNDIWMFFGGEGAQLNQAMAFYNSIAGEKYNSNNITVTGHSLGGGLADIIAACYGCRGESFNSAPFLDVAYWYHPQEMSALFEGTDAFRFKAHANESDQVVGNNPGEHIKPLWLYKNNGLVGAHSLTSIVTRDANESPKLTESFSEWSPSVISQKVSVLLNNKVVLGTTTSNNLKYSEYSLVGTNLYWNYAVYGGAGADNIITSPTGDTISGGKGNDTIDGGWGDDTYIYYKGHGVDTIVDTSGHDKLLVLGFSASDIIHVEEGDDTHAYVTVNGSTIVKIAKRRSNPVTGLFNSFTVSSDQGFEQNIESYLKDKKSFFERLQFSCPVNVEIVNNSTGEVVYTLYDQIEATDYTDYGNFYVFEQEDGEYVKIADLIDGYSVRVVGVNDGAMDAVVLDTDGFNLSEPYTAQDVPVTKDMIATVEEDGNGGKNLVIDTDADGQPDLTVPLTVTADDPDEPSTGETNTPSPPSYQITIIANPSTGGRVWIQGSTNTSATYQEGASVTVVAEANSGYRFVRWTENGKQVNASASYTFTADKNVELTAVFEKTGGGGGNGAGSGTSSSSSSSSNQITAPAAENGTVTITPKFAKSGEKVTITAKPDNGYTVGSVTVTDRNGKSISVTDNCDGTYTFTMPASQVTVSVKFVPVGTWVNPFTDVSESHWFYEYVAYVVQNGLMKGEGNGQFNPGGTTTRGMIMIILARLAGVDTSGSSPWYQVGMEWAVTEGVSDGTSPEAEITREQLATMLWRYAGEPATTGDLSAYPDAGDVHADWAGTAMIWAVENGIINGSDGKLNPQGNALRSEAAAMLTRYCQNIKK